eukprot:406280-Amphidinium_carterae.1
MGRRDSLMVSRGGDEELCFQTARRHLVHAMGGELSESQFEELAQTPIGVGGLGILAPDGRQWRRLVVPKVVGEDRTDARRTWAVQWDEL